MSTFSPSPIPATTDQADTIRQLTALGRDPRINVAVDAGGLDVEATEPCDDDWSHGWGTVCLPTGGRVCPVCAAGWLWWHSGEQVALDVLRVPAAPALADAA